MDTSGQGIERVTENGVVVDGVEYEVDCLIFATGFEVGTAYTRRAEFAMYGRDGLSLADYWANGMRTYHGFLSHGFPNCFHMGLTQTGLTANFTYMLNKQAHHVAQLITLGQSAQSEINRADARGRGGVGADREQSEPHDQLPKRLHAGLLQRRGDKRGRLPASGVPERRAGLFRFARPLA